ncbi:MAG: hypothetical protein FWD15_05195 [Alphaproteobacteria bacterium]|nr:hypothetical protein [Alphaproteobacteria bacterium]
MNQFDNFGEFDGDDHFGEANGFNFNNDEYCEDDSEDELSPREAEPENYARSPDEVIEFLDALNKLGCGMSWRYSPATDSMGDYLVSKSSYLNYEDTNADDALLSGHGVACLISDRHSSDNQGKFNIVVPWGCFRNFLSRQEKGIMNQMLMNASIGYKELDTCYNCDHGGEDVFNCQEKERQGFLDTGIDPNGTCDFHSNKIQANKKQR